MSTALPTLDSPAAFRAKMLGLTLAATLVLSGCSKSQPNNAAPNQGPPQQQGQYPPQQQQGQYPPQQGQYPQQQQQGQYGPPQQQGAYAPPPQREERRTERAAAPGAPREAAPLTIPAGTHIRVETREDLGSKLSQPGQTFTATVVDPVVVNGVTVVKNGSSATGTVVDAKPLGRFKGEATLELRLDSIHAEGRTYEVASSTIDRVEKGKGKRTAALIGGGGGLGALIGGIAGGGKGALIGGLAGAGAGTAGTAFTGNKEIVIPAETPLTFRLERSVTVGR